MQHAPQLTLDDRIAGRCGATVAERSNGLYCSFDNTMIHCYEYENLYLSNSSVICSTCTSQHLRIPKTMARCINPSCFWSMISFHKCKLDCVLVRRWLIERWVTNNKKWVVDACSYFFRMTKKRNVDQVVVECVPVNLSGYFWHLSESAWTTKKADQHRIVSFGQWEAPTQNNVLTAKRRRFAFHRSLGHNLLDRQPSSPFW